jgi:Mrp family chromosome partitioning ATPase
LEEAIKNTYLQNLQVITSGNNHSESIPALAFSVLDSIIEKMKSKADWILFDGPPIHASNDAIALAPNVDGVIIVIKAEKTRWEAAQNARQRIESGKGNIIGVVLNERRFYIPEWLYQRLG